MADEDQKQNPGENSNEQNPLASSPPVEKTFLERLSEEYRVDPTISTFKDENNLAKSYLELRKKTGGMITIPHDKMSDEDKKAFFERLKSIPEIMPVLNATSNPEEIKQVFSKLGMPEEADKYNAEIPKDMAISPEELTEFKKEAHEMNLTQVQFDKLLAKRLVEIQEGLSGFATYKKENEDVLRKEWGDAYTNRRVGAERAIDFFKSKYPSFGEYITDELRENAGFLVAMSQLGQALSEGTSPKVAVPQYGETPSNIQLEIDNLTREPAYFNSLDPNHNKIVQKVNSLFETLVRMNNR